MATQLNREGIFLARPTAWSIQSKQDGSTQSAALMIHYRVEYELAADGNWNEVPPDTETVGMHNVIKADGTINQGAVERLKKVLGWSALFGDVVGTSPPDLRVRVDVKRNDYQGKTSWRVEWLNAESDPIGGKGGLDETGARNLDAKYGHLMRAVGGQQRPGGKAPPPPPSKGAGNSPAPAAQAGQTGQAAQPALAGIDPKDVPF